MDRLFAVVLLAAQVALWPGYGEETAARPVFFSLLFPQLMPRAEAAPRGDGFVWPFEDAAGEAVYL